MDWPWIEFTSLEIKSSYRINTDSICNPMPIFALGSSLVTLCERKPAHLVLIPGGILRLLGVQLNVPFNDCPVQLYWNWIRERSSTTPVRRLQCPSASTLQNEFQLPGMDCLGKLSRLRNAGTQTHSAERRPNCCRRS